MSREIKFRVWDGLDRKYCTGLDAGEVFTTYASNNGKKAEITLNQLLVRGKQDDFLPEQYTGLKDKNGKEIYEGDIVKVYTWTNLTKGIEYRYTTKVFWQERYAQFNTTYNDALSNEITQDFFEVIGNIHENGDLLEKGEE